VSPLAPVDLAPGLNYHVESFGESGRVVVIGLALAAVLADLPRVALAVAVFVFCQRYAVSK
jgi:hypothetical protein